MDSVYRYEWIEGGKRAKVKLGRRNKRQEGIEGRTGFEGETRRSDGREEGACGGEVTEEELDVDEYQEKKEEDRMNG